MKFLFLCGSLEPGRDGVGDYVRRLAMELLRKGHHASAIALNDQYIEEIFFGNQTIEGVNLTVLRLPSFWATSRRFARAAQWVDEFGADWLSLQFVPFAFHKKGLPFALSKQLLSVGRGKNWHIMFHELWVGMEREAPAKYRILGEIQQMVIKGLIHQLRPQKIHTHTHLYQIQLARLGLTADSLPLFGNIPVANIEVGTCDALVADVKQPISFVLFGNIHHGSLVQQFTDEAAAYARAAGISLALVLVGRCGPEATPWIAAWEAAGLAVEVLGEQSPTCVSAILQKATFGLTTTPAALVEKSGTAAAMREHGLRVICVERPWHPRTMEALRKPTGVAVYSPGNFKDCVAPSNESVPNENTVSFIAERLLNHLTMND